MFNLTRLIFKLTNKAVKFILIFVLGSFVFITNIAIAEIYKWRYQSGVIQYSDSLPKPFVGHANAKSLHQHAINGLQASHTSLAKKYCDYVLVKQQNNQSPILIANFFDFSGKNAARNNNVVGSKNSLFGGVWNQKAATSSPVFPSVNPVTKISPSVSKPVQYLPFNPTGFLNFGGKTITVFGKPILVAQAPIKLKPIPMTLPTPTPTPAPVPTDKIFYIAPNGDNNNDGSEALPWRNLNHAVYALKAGETVLVKNGIYQESLHINKSGLPGKPITYKAYPGHKPKIEINKKQLEGILIQGASYINIDGFEVVYTALGAEAAKGEQTDNGIDISNAGQVLPHHINIKNNNVHGFPGGGIFTVLADYITFEGNTVWENALWAKWGNSGISMYQNVEFDQKTGYHMIIRGNTVYKNENKLPSYAIGSTTITDGNCIIIDDLRHTQKFLDNKTPYPAYKANTLIENNVCYDNGARGIHVYSSDNVLVRHNTLYKNQRTASINDGELSVYDASNVRFVNNIVFATAGKKLNGAGNATNIFFERNLYFGSANNLNKSATDIVADPLFVNASVNPAVANFRLNAGSPAIDAALVTQSPAIDNAGKVRSLGVAPDIGAFESY